MPCLEENVITLDCNLNRHGEEYKRKAGCQNITALFCDLTDVTPAIPDVYYWARVFVNDELHGSTTRFSPLTESKNHQINCFILFPYSLSLTCLYKMKHLKKHNPVQVDLFTYSYLTLVMMWCGGSQMFFLCCTAAQWQTNSDSDLFVIAIFGPPTLSTEAMGSNLHVHATLPLLPNGSSIGDIMTRSNNWSYKPSVYYILEITDPKWAAQVSLTSVLYGCFAQTNIQYVGYQAVRCSELWFCVCRLKQTQLVSLSSH